MTTDGFTPTHEVPEGGTASWTTPDPASVPDGRLDARLPVVLLGETTGWAHVRCSNGWETWVARAPLVPLGVPATEQVVEAGTEAGAAGTIADAFSPTHRVGGAPLDARDRPDLGHGSAASLDPGLPVVMVERWGDWARVRCANDWEAWVDGRGLLAWDAPEPSPPVAEGPSVTPAAATRARPLDRYLPMVGAALALVGSFLPWFSAGGFSVSAWDLRFVGLFTHESSDIAIDTGPVLLVLVLAAVPLLTRRPLPRWLVVVLGALAVLCAVLALALPDPKPDPGIGLFLTLVGGVVMLAAPVVSRLADRRG